MAIVVMPPALQPHSVLEIIWTKDGPDTVEVITGYTPATTLRENE
jgi:hypothetical protein